MIRSPVCRADHYSSASTNHRRYEKDIKNEESGYSYDQIFDLASMGINKNGLTYGPDCMGTDLIFVTSDQGGGGYVYRKDYEVGCHVKTPEEADAWSKSQTEPYGIPMYERTIILL